MIHFSFKIRAGFVHFKTYEMLIEMVLSFSCIHKTEAITGSITQTKMEGTIVVPL